MQYQEMSKAQLLDVAKIHHIQGRHDMTKDELLEAVLEQVDETDETTEEAEDDEAEAAEIQAIEEAVYASKDELVQLKRRSRQLSPRPRDEAGRVIRKERNLSGNAPYRRKFYALAESLADESQWPEDYRAALQAAPNQVRGILKYMREAGIVGTNSEQGGEIAGGAINHGFITSKIEPAVLFSYYRRVLEALGVQHVEED